ncbi:MAG: LPS export ABC transporter periplasmic protein LptC [Campylobacter ureolyticus]|nr:LPS export ABC transporter periplasmic protein LptC [Campylobacter ureolyticus]MDK8323621.1 LPS export ABC transporter periplasmic protein LptC [Campylobacter ureolyticus]
MAIRIFYFGIAIFSVMMVILSVQTPYFSDFFKNEIDLAQTEIFDIADYEVTEEKIIAKYEADKGVKYKDKDEFENFKGLILNKDTNHTLSSKKAIHKDDIIEFLGNAEYKNSDEINYISDEIFYNTKTKIATSNKPFILWQNENNVTGLNLMYDLNTKQTFATGVNGWFIRK